MSQIPFNQEQRHKALHKNTSLPVVFMDKDMHLNNTTWDYQKYIYFADDIESGHLLSDGDNEPEIEPAKKGIFNVLYIEDNPSSLKLVKNILDIHLKINMLSASSAEAGLKIAKENSVDLILLDINLPGMDGFEALQHLQKDEKTKKIKVLAVSAAAAPHDIEKGIIAGFKHYLTKPIDVDEFIEILNLELNHKE